MEGWLGEGDGRVNGLPHEQRAEWKPARMPMCHVSSCRGSSVNEKPTRVRMCPFAPIPMYLKSHSFVL